MLTTTALLAWINRGATLNQDLTLLACKPVQPVTTSYNQLQPVATLYKDLTQLASKPV